MENEQNIEIDVFVNVKDYRRVLFWHSRNTIYKILFTLFVSLPILYYFAGFGDGINLFNLGNVVTILRFGVIAVFVFLLIILASLIYSIWKQTDQLKNLFEETKFIFSENGIESICKLCSSDRSWESFVKICETELDFIIFQQETMFYPIPKRFFESQMQINEFKELLSQKLGEKAELLN